MTLIERALSYCTTCHDHRRAVQVDDVVIALETDFDLTKGKRYTVTGVFADDLEIMNDKGITEMYTSEYFIYEADFEGAVAMLTHSGMPI